MVASIFAFTYNSPFNPQDIAINRKNFDKTKHRFIWCLVLS